MFTFQKLDSEKWYYQDNRISNALIFLFWLYWDFEKFEKSFANISVYNVRNTVIIIFNNYNKL
jgi:tetraacyldisaccharide-1-P 4'-kinase